MEPISTACDALFDLSPGRLIVGCSGGMDSMVLLHALAGAGAVRGELDRVLAVHVDHGLDPDSNNWAEACAREAALLKVDYQSTAVVALEPGSNLEARARAARYRVFEECLAEDDLLLLAHHAGDQTESLLLHLLQGRGLYGMPKSRTLGCGRLVRPLLEFSRTELAAYARAYNLTWIEDPGNADLTLDRNFLRHSLLPDLNERFPELPKRLETLAGSTAATASALVEIAGLTRHPLPLSLLDGRSQPTRLSLLRHWLIAHNAGGAITTAALAEFLRQLDAANDRQPSLTTPAGRLTRFRRQLYLVNEPADLAGHYPLDVPGESVLPHGVLRATRAVAETDADAVVLVPPFRVTFEPELGEERRMWTRGQYRNLRELMRETGVPPWKRDTLPLLVDELGPALLPGVAVRDPAWAREGATARGIEPLLVNVRWNPDVH